MSLSKVYPQIIPTCTISLFNIKVRYLCSTKIFIILENGDLVRPWLIPWAGMVFHCRWHHDQEEGGGRRWHKLQSSKVMSDKLLKYEDDPVLHREIVAAMPDKPQFTLKHHKAKFLGHLPGSLAIHYPGQKSKREMRVETEQALQSSCEMHRRKDSNKLKKIQKV